jgi:methionyl aminopeptidase
MAIKLKTRADIEKMRQAGAIVHDVLEELTRTIKPGVTTGQLDRQAEQMTREFGAKPLFKGVPNPRAGYSFPACICASIDSEVVHGIPTDDRVLQEGQIISIDFGVRIGGWCGDAAVTVPVGRIDERKTRLLDATRGMLDIAIAEIRPNELWSRVAAKMQAHAESQGFSVVTSFVGHGIGREMHEDPKVPNYVSRELTRNDILLEPGLVLAIEPMVNIGGASVAYASDGWTIVTQDGLPSAHFEHTVAVTEHGVEVLTDGRRTSR